MIEKDTKGVSPVIGVILMIVLAVILAAVVSQFAVELQSLLDDPIQAGVIFNEDVGADGEYDVEVVWSTKGSVEKIVVIEPSGAETPPVENVGSSVTVGGLEEGDTLRVVGVTDDGSRGVLTQHTVGD